MAINGQININRSSAPNSPTGSDSLFIAFGKIQDNFDTLFQQATTFKTANIITGTGLAKTPDPDPNIDTITITNTGVLSVTMADTNITTTAVNGDIIIAMATSLTGLTDIASGNVNAAIRMNTLNITVSDTVSTANLTASGNITAGNITATTITNAGTVLKLTPIPTAPATPTQGTIYYDSFMNMLRVYNGIQWGNIAIS